MTGEKPKRPPTRGTRHGKGAGHGGPAKGRGHGGPAKGASQAPGSVQTAPAFSPGNVSSGVPGYRTLSREQRLEAIREAQWGDAFDPELAPRDRLAARVDLQNRLGGLPVATVVTAEAPTRKLPDDVLDRAIADIERALGGVAGGAEGGEEPAVIGKSPGVL